jgi:protein TonB
MMTAPSNPRYPMSDPHTGASPNARFLIGDVPQAASARKRFGNAMSVSAAAHVVGFFVIVILMTMMPELRAPDSPINDLTSDIIWIAQEGPGGGGGGGGNETPEPPKKAELPGKEKVTVPVAKPPKLDPKPPEPKPEPKMNIPAVTQAAAIQEMPGALSGLPSVPSQGVGTLGGAGSGAGSGIGSGTGSGLGAGSGGGTGGGVYRPGSGVTNPKLLVEVKPSYTADAMRAKIQGVVTLEAVVLPDGTVGNVQIVRSLDRTFGLDQEAIKTVKRWRFAPGTRMGQPVPVLVEIEMTFTLR